jgi:hypothetical protein
MLIQRLFEILLNSNRSSWSGVLNIREKFPIFKIDLFHELARNFEEDNL